MTKPMPSMGQPGEAPELKPRPEMGENIYEKDAKESLDKSGDNLLKSMRDMNRIQENIDQIKNIEDVSKSVDKSMVRNLDSADFDKKEREMGGMDKKDSSKFEQYSSQSEKISKLFGSKEAMTKFADETLGMDEAQRDLLKQYGVKSQEIFDYMEKNHIDSGSWMSMSFEDRDKVVRGLIAQKENEAASMPSGVVEDKEIEYADGGTVDDNTKVEYADGGTVDDAQSSEEKVDVSQKLESDDTGSVETGNTESPSNDSEAVDVSLSDMMQQGTGVDNNLISEQAPEKELVAHEDVHTVTPGKTVTTDEPLVNPVTGQVIGEATLESMPSQSVQTEATQETNVQPQTTVNETVNQEETLAQINMKNQHGVEEWYLTPDGDYYVRTKEGSEVLPPSVFGERYGKTLEDSQGDYETTY